MNRLRITIASVVAAVWVISFLATIFVDTALEGLATTATPVMLGVVGWLFAGEVLERRYPPASPPGRRPKGDR